MEEMNRPQLDLGDRKRALLDLVRTSPAGDAPDALDRIAPRPEGSTVPLSFAQERLWRLEQLVWGYPLYNRHVVFLVDRAIDPDALDRALQRLVARHDQLRCSFVDTPDGPVQTIAPEATAPLRRIDLSTVAAADRQEAAEAGLVDLKREPFDLTRGPLLRVGLLTLDRSRHLVVVVVHEIVCDGRSIGILSRELWALYDQEASGRVAELPPLPVEYADFAAWQRERVAGDGHDGGLRFWTDSLAGLRELALPTDRVRPAEASHQGEFVPVPLPAVLADEVRRLADGEDCTTSMMLLAAFGVLLGLHSGMNDIAVGVPVADRQRPELEGLVGSFVNTVVVRLSLAGDPTFREVVHRVRDTALEAFRHQDVPFERLVQHLQPDRDPSRNPLVQVTFQHAEGIPGVPDPGMDDDPPPQVARGMATFDLRLDTWDAADGIGGRLEYSSDLFDRDTATGMAELWIRLLQLVAVDPDRPLSSIDLVSPAERRLLVETWNRTARPYRADGGIHRLVERRAMRHPDAVAIDAGETRLTYGRLLARSGAVTRALRTRRSAPESLVGVFLDRCVGLVVAELGILRAGCAYVPLDPTYPTARLELMLQDCRPDIVLTERRFVDRLPPGPFATLLLEKLDPGTEPVSSVDVDPEGLAYVMYTSGSTGRPKGIRIPHRGICRLVSNEDYVYFRSDDVVGYASNVSFDASTFEVWGALANGARLASIDRDTLLSPAALAGHLRRHGVTVLFITTALFDKVMDEQPDAFATLRVLIAGGSVFDPRSGRRLFDHGQPARFLNAYGPTENTTFSTMYELTEPPEPDRAVPIGRPIANTTAYVLDERARLVPVGVPGELCVGGDGVALGYHERPELTESRFVPDPFASRPGRLLYRTGDRVRLRRNGDIEFLGRVDRQVKVRGFRVELDDIEATLRGHPVVRDLVVEARRDGTDEPRLVAYVRVAAPEDDAASNGHGSADGTNQDSTTLVEHWRHLYDDVLFARPSSEDPTFEISGWASSYTGQPIPAEHMREQVDGAVTRILSSHPRRVLEIGCGTGLLLFQLAPHVESYVGTDFSTSALDHVRRHVHRLGEAARRVRLEQRTAEDFSGFAPGSFDAVVLNSVIQYFPSLDYLEEVIAGAVRVTAPGGTVFVGDVRFLPLLRALHASVTISQAGPQLSTDALVRRIDARLDQEQELVVAPAWFTSLPEHHSSLRAVTVEQKRGRSDNELTRFRGDVWLHVGPLAEDGREVGADSTEPLAWEREIPDLAALERRLVDDRPEAVFVTGIPNARLQADHEVLAVLALPDRPADAGTIQQLAAAAAGGVHPEDVWAIGERLPYDVHVTWTPGREEQTFDALFVRRPNGRPVPVTFPLPQRLPDGLPSASDPVRGSFLRRVVPELRRFAANQLPEYMQPAAYMLVDDLPLNENGKVDAARLPPPDFGQRPADTYQPTRTDTELAVSRVFTAVLGADAGIYDNFFAELGGNSLLANQVVVRLTYRLGVDLKLRSLFDHPTIAELATHVDGLLAQRGPAVPIEGEGTARIDAPGMTAEQR